MTDTKYESTIHTLIISEVTLTSNTYPGYSEVVLIEGPIPANARLTLRLLSFSDLDYKEEGAFLQLNHDSVHDVVTVEDSFFYRISSGLFIVENPNFSDEGHSHGSEEEEHEEEHEEGHEEAEEDHINEESTL